MHTTIVPFRHAHDDIDIAVVEFFGGVAVPAAWYAELAASLFGFQMIVGTFWDVEESDYSYDLQVLALCVSIMSFGAGHISIASFAALSSPR